MAEDRTRRVVRERALTQMEAIASCINVLNEIDGIEARADAAEYLAKIYRDAAENAKAE